MDITPLIPKTSQVIQSYGAEGFKVSGVSYSGGIVIYGEKTFDWTSGTLENLTISDFDFLNGLDDRPDVFLLGTGKQMRFIPRELKHQLSQKNIHIEPMDTGAACRTYNTLLADGRKVCACLLINDL